MVKLQLIGVRVNVFTNILLYINCMSISLDRQEEPHSNSPSFCHKAESNLPPRRASGKDRYCVIHCISSDRVR